MSEQYEPSYYEIALTGRQVLVAFVILMVCLVAAFFSGVWVGREEAKKDQGPQMADVQPAEVPADEVAGQTAAAEPETAQEASSTESDPAEGSGDGVFDALSFFSGEDEAAEAETGGQERPPERPEPAADRPEPEPSEDEGGGSEAEAAGAIPSGSPTGGLAGGDVVIQVFSSPDRTKAQEILERLEANEFRAFISPLTDGGETFYRVRVGPFEYESDARRVAEELRRKLDLETWITR